MRRNKKQERKKEAGPQGEERPAVLKSEAVLEAMVDGLWAVDLQGKNAAGKIKS